MPTDTATLKFSADWGPWSAAAPPADVRHGVTLLFALSSVICGRFHPLTTALHRADLARDDALGMLREALGEAARELERLPALRRRNLLSNYQNCIRKYPDAARPRTKPQAKGAAA